MKSDIYLSGTADNPIMFSLSENTQISLELDLNALGTKDSTITEIHGDFVYSVKNAGTSTLTSFPFTLGDFNVSKKVDVVLRPKLNDEFKLQDFPISFHIATREFGRHSHLIQVNLGVKPKQITYSGKLEAPDDITLGNIGLELSDAILSNLYKSFTLENSGEISLAINKISFLEFDGSSPDYVSFTDSSGTALSYPQIIEPSSSLNVYVKINTQSTHTDDNYTRILPVPINLFDGFQVSRNPMMLIRDIQNEQVLNWIMQYCRIQINSNDYYYPNVEFPIVNTQFVAPLINVNENTIDFLNVLEGSNSYQDIYIKNESGTENLIISNISTDYYVTTSNGQSSGTPVDYISFSEDGNDVSFPLTILPRQLKQITVNFKNATFPEPEISGSNDFTYFKQHSRTLTIKSNAVNSSFPSGSTYADVKSNKTGETTIDMLISITKKGKDISPAEFIRPDFDIILGGTSPNDIAPILMGISENIGRDSNDSNWSSQYEQYDLNDDDEIDIYDLATWVNNPSSTENSIPGLPNAEAVIYEDNSISGTSKSLAESSQVISFINRTTSSLVNDDPLGIASDGDYLEYKLTISTNDYEISNNYHRDVPKRLSTLKVDGVDKSISLTSIDEPVKAYGKKSTDSDWASYSKFDVVSTNPSTNKIDTSDLTEIEDRIKKADEQERDILTEISDNFGKTSISEGEMYWPTIEHLDLNNDGQIDVFDLSTASTTISEGVSSKWIKDSSKHTWDSINKVQIIKDWDDGNSWVYRGVWSEVEGSDKVVARPGIHFSKINNTRESEMESSLDLTFTLYARRKYDVNKKEYSTSKTIKLFSGGGSVPSPIVNYKFIARNESKFENEGRAYNVNLEEKTSGLSLAERQSLEFNYPSIGTIADNGNLADAQKDILQANPKWEIFDIKNHSIYAKATGISEGMKGVWFENKSNSNSPGFAEYTYNWKFSVDSDGVDNEDDYGFVIQDSSTTANNGKIAWKTNDARPTGSSDDYNIVDSTYWTSQKTSWQPKGLVYKTSGNKEINFKIDNNTSSTTSGTDKKYLKLYKEYNTKIEITPVEVELYPKTLQKGQTSGAFITLKNTTNDYKYITIEPLRPQPNTIRFSGNDNPLDEKLQFTLEPQSISETGSVKEIGIFVDINSKRAGYKKDFTEGKVKITSDSSEDYLVLDLYGEETPITFDLEEFNVEFGIEDHSSLRIPQHFSMTGFGTTGQTESPHAFLIGFQMSDSHLKDVASNAHQLKVGLNPNLSINFETQDDYVHSREATFNLSEQNVEFSIGDGRNETGIITENHFKNMFVDDKTPEAIFSLTDDKSKRISLSYSISHDILLQLSDDKTHRQLNKIVQVSSTDPTIEFKLNDSQTRTIIKTHSIKVSSEDPLVDLNFIDSKDSVRTFNTHKHMTFNNDTLELDFSIADSQTSRKPITHDLTVGSSTTLGVSMQFSDSQSVIRDIGAWKEIKINNADPTIELYWRDSYTKTIT